MEMLKGSLTLKPEACHRMMEKLRIQCIKNMHLSLKCSGKETPMEREAVEVTITLTPDRKTGKFGNCEST